MKLFLSLFLLILAGCGAPPAIAPSLPAVNFDQSWYQQAESAGQQILTIDPQQSLIAITVRRGGRLAKLGHDHVVASRHLNGLVAAEQGRADFYFRLSELSVDEPALRRAAGLEPELPANAIQATRLNMLSKVLEADRFPFVVLHAEPVAGDLSLLRLSISLHGVTRSMDVPTQIERSENRVTASGTLRLLQSEFNIEPVSVLNGALVVLDPLELRFHIVAHRPAP
jgi:hypothetical protein